MNKNPGIKKTAIFCVAVISLSIFFLIFLRSIPIKKIWNSYSVVYVEKSLSEQKVLEYFKMYGIQNYVSFSNQEVPFINEVTPVIPQTKNSYLYTRMNFFSDKSFKYNLFYIPDSSEKKISNVLNKISQDFNVQTGVDGKKQFPWSVCAICFLVYVFFIILSRNKFVFALAGFFPLMLTLALPFYPVASGVILFFLAFYLAQNIWLRKNFIQCALKNLYFSGFSICGFLILFIFSWKSAILSVLCILSSFSLLYLLAEFQKYQDSKSSFSYVKILSAKQIPVMYKQRAYLSLLTCAPMICLAVLFLISARFTNLNSSRSLAIPCPVENISDADYEFQSNELPCIDDFYKWTFWVQTFPYRSLNDNSINFSVAENQKVSITRYENSEKGINVFEEEILTYNDSFKNSVDKKIEDFSNNSLEKFLRKQGRELKVAYSTKLYSKASQQNDYISLILLLAGIFVPALMSLFYFLFGRKS